MVVILPEEEYEAWLNAPARSSMDFMRQCPPAELVATEAGNEFGA
jgi:putative SOS response-associated peptidase YedK